MRFSQSQWLYGGIGGLVVVSSIVIISGMPSVWVPMPLPIVLMAFINRLLFPFVTSFFYVLVLKFLLPTKGFAKIVLALVVVFGLLNTLYFQISWEYGIKYQGLKHTKIVAIENFVGFGTAFTIAIIALVKRSHSLALTANLLLFVLLSWCAFPYLGELP